MKMIKIFKLAALFVLISPFHSMSQWMQTGGPLGGRLGDIVKVGSTLVVCGNGGVYRSEDNGDTWEKSISGMPKMPGIYVLTKYGESLYVSLYKHGIYMSQDEGQTWEAINNGIEDETFYSLFVEGANIYAGPANGGVFYSPDNGVTWTEQSSGLEDVQVQEFVSFNSKVYAGGSSLDSGSGILFEYSRDDNAWNKIQTPGLYRIVSMVVDNNNFYIAGDGNVFLAIDDLDSWSELNLNTMSTITSMRLFDDGVYLTTGNGQIYYTLDDGQNWLFMKNSLTDDFAEDALFLQSKILMTTNQGLFQSVDFGNSWDESNKGIKAHDITCFGARDSFLFAGTYSQGTFRSGDNGNTWKKIFSGPSSNLNSSTINNIIVIGERIFLSTDGGIYASSDNGETWINVFDPPKLNSNLHALDFDNGIMVAVVSYGDIYISKDTAETWTPVAASGINLNTSFTSIELVGDTIALSTYDGEIFVSTDLAANWIESPVGLDFYFTYKLLYNNNKLYAATNNGLFVSESLGKEWNHYGGYNNDMYDVSIVSDTIYGGINSGLFIMHNEDSWFKSSGLPGLTITNILRANEYVFGGTFTSSVWRIPENELKIPDKITETNERFTDKAIVVFPNPASESLNISFKNAFSGKIEAQLGDLNGRVVISHKYYKDKTDFNEKIILTQVPKGVYFLKIIQGTRCEFIQRIVVR